MLIIQKLASGINLHVVEAGDRNAKLIVLLHGKLIYFIILLFYYFII
jgi:hypothetical protein